MNRGDEMGFSVLNFYIIMPLVSFITALIVGIKDAYMKWVYPVVFGVYGLFIPVLIFNSFDFIALFFSFIPALAGVGIGWLINKKKGRA